MWVSVSSVYILWNEETTNSEHQYWCERILSGALALGGYSSHGNEQHDTENIVHRSRPRLRHLSLSTFDVDGSYVTTTMAFFSKLAQNCDILLRQVIEDRVTIMIISIR